MIGRFRKLSDDDDVSGSAMVNQNLKEQVFLHCVWKLKVKVKLRRK